MTTTTNVSLTSISGIILLIVVLSVGLIAHRSLGATYALWLNRLGLYELGEAVYSKVVRERDYSLAVIVDPKSHDDEPQEIEQERLNKAVNFFYGAESPQMAKRYMVVAGNLYSNFSDFGTASKYFEKARAIYSRLGNQDRALTAVAQLTYMDFCRKNQSECKRHMREASLIVPQNLEDEQVRLMLSMLWSLAHRTHEQGLASHFLKLLKGKPVAL